MIGLGAIAKLARGGMDPDSMRDLLKAAGMDLSFSAVEVSPAAFTGLAQAASLPGSKLVSLKGRMKDGSTITALLVVNQNSNPKP